MFFRRGLELCEQRQAAGVRMFLSFVRLGIPAFEVCEGHVQRLAARAGFGWAVMYLPVHGW